MNKINISISINNQLVKSIDVDNTQENYIRQIENWSSKVKNAVIKGGVITGVVNNEDVRIVVSR